MANAPSEPLPAHQHHQHHPMHRDRPSTGDHDRDVHGLRMALGSILNPKRAPSSRTSSGTASPNPAHFGPGLVHPYPYPPHQQDGHNSHSHAHTPHIPSLLHTPHESQNDTHELKDSSSSSSSSSPTAELRPSLVFTRSHSQSSFDSEASSESGSNSAPPIVTTSNTIGMTTTNAEAEAKAKKMLKDERRRKNAEETEQKEKMAAYLSTLQSKRAWDVLVHGNMA